MATNGIRSKNRAAALAKIPVKTRFGYFLAYGHNAPNLLAKNLSVAVDVFRRHVVAAGFCSVGSRHDLAAEDRDS